MRRDETSGYNIWINEGTGICETTAVAADADESMDLINLELSCLPIAVSASSLSDALYVLPIARVWQIHHGFIKRHSLYDQTDSDGQSGVLEHEIMPLNNA